MWQDCNQSCVARLQSELCGKTAIRVVWQDCNQSCVARLQSELCGKTAIRVVWQDCNQSCVARLQSELCGKTAIRVVWQDCNQSCEVLLLAPVTCWFITKTCPCNIHVLRIFSEAKTENFIGKKKYIFNIFAQNIDCVYTLEPPR